MSRESPGLGDRARCSVRGRPSFSSLCKPREGQVQGASVSVVQGRTLVWQPGGPAAAQGWPSPSCESESPGDFLKAQMPRTFHSHTEPDSPRISRKHLGAGDMLPGRGRSAQGGWWDGPRQGSFSVPGAPGSTGMVITQKHKLVPGAISMNCDVWSIRDWGFWNVQCACEDHKPQWGFTPFFK